jgi:ABC-type nickel/cobalt efflux system permease component RcnA
LCHLRHKFFYGGSWTAAYLSRLTQGLPVISFPLINGVGWWNLLRELRIQLSIYTIHQDKYSTTLLEEPTS